MFVSIDLCMLSSNWNWNFFITYIKECKKIIEDFNLTHQLGPNGTAIEGDWEDVFKCVKNDMKNPSKRCSKDIYNYQSKYKN